MYALNLTKRTNIYSIVFLKYYIVATIVLFIGCKSTTNNKPKNITLPVSSINYISSGGIQGDRILCATAANDVIVPLDSLDSPPKAGEPLMTVEGIEQFINENQIDSVTEVLNALPIHYRTNFSLIEKSKGSSLSSLEYPRMVLFGSDGRVLLNFGTDKKDPSYKTLNVAELHEDTGRWEFSVFDFKNDKVKLQRNPNSCKSCHGNILRPIWGTNLDWAGAFGDNVAAGPQGEALDTKHLIN